MNEYTFEKRKEVGYVGYLACCFCIVDIKGKKFEVSAIKHLEDLRDDEEIPEETKKELIAMIEHKVAQQS